MTVRRSIAPLCMAGFLVLAGCGGTDASSGSPSAASTSHSSTITESERTENPSSRTTSSAESSTRTSSSTSTASSTSAPTRTGATEPDGTDPSPSTASGPSRTGGAAPDTSGTKPWRDLRTGECIADVPEGTFTEVELIDCASPHEAQALEPMRAVTLRGRPAQEAAQAQCDEALAASGIAGDALIVAPIVETQGTLLARAVCLIISADGSPLTGSVVAG